MVLPKYVEIKNELLKEIELKPVDTPIDSERELAIKYNASRMTVRNAVNELVNEGYLYRNKNKGTYIADKTYQKKQGPYGDLFGSSDIEYTIIYYNVKKLPELCSYLHLSEDEYILRVVRVSKQDELPISVEEIYFDYQYVNKDDIKMLYRLMNLNEYAKDGKVVQRFYPTIVPPQYVNLLDMKPNSPIIMIESTISLPDGKPIILVRSYRGKNDTIEITI